jgi:hypothetical protein
MVFIFMPLVGTNIKACHALQHHILALELDMDVFIEVLEPLLVLPILEATRLVVNIDDEDLLVERWPKRISNYE